MRRCLFLLLHLVILPLFADAKISIPCSLTHESVVAKGEVVKGQIPIRNTGTSEGKVKIIHVDYLYNATGQTFYLETGSHKRSNSSWMKISTNYIVVPPKGMAEGSYQINVPKDVAEGGTYWSMILVEPITEISPFDLTKDNTVSISTVLRYGIQIVNHIENSGKYDLKLSNKCIENEDDKKFFKIEAENVGSLMLAPVMSIELFDSKGKNLGQFKSKKQRILPTCSVKYAVDLSEVKEGTYKAIVVFDHGENDIFGAEYTLSL